LFEREIFAYQTLETEKLSLSSIGFVFEIVLEKIAATKGVLSNVAIDKVRLHNDVAKRNVFVTSDNKEVHAASKLVFEC
jgi:hypothetical protein